MIRKHTGKEGWKKEGEMECVLALTQPSFCALERREIKLKIFLVKGLKMWQGMRTEHNITTIDAV